MEGATSLQGPHHSAQKSTSTGRSACEKAIFTFDDRSKELAYKVIESVRIYMRIHSFQERQATNCSNIPICFSCATKSPLLLYPPFRVALSIYPFIELFKDSFFKQWGLNPENDILFGALPSQPSSHTCRTSKSKSASVASTIALITISFLRICKTLSGNIRGREKKLQGAKGFDSGDDDMAAVALGIHRLWPDITRALSSRRRSRRDGEFVETRMSVVEERAGEAHSRKEADEDTEDTEHIVLLLPQHALPFMVKFSRETQLLEDSNLTRAAIEQRLYYSKEIGKLLDQCCSKQRRMGASIPFNRLAQRGTGRWAP